MKSLFIKHKVNPLHSLMVPIAQLPVFIGFFLALQSFGLYYPDYVTGGTLWFTDLTASDATYVLPILNGLSFLLMTEIGVDGMEAAQKGQFRLGMRCLAVAIVPLTMSMPQVCFLPYTCYCYCCDYDCPSASCSHTFTML